jgi:hypothetical protein
MDSSSGLSSFVKAAMIVVAGFLVFAILFGAAAWYWFSQNKQRIIDGTQKAISEGKDDGLHMTEQQCLDATLKRLNEKKSMLHAVEHNLYFGACLETCQPSDGFCNGVPAGDKLFENMKWQKQRCKELKLDESRCGAVLGLVQQHCRVKRESIQNNSPSQN